MKNKSIFRPACLGTIAATMITLGALSGSALAADEVLKLSGESEVPPVTTKATGSGTFTIGSDMSVAGKVTTTGVAGNAAHIHVGKADANGPVAVPLVKSGDGVWMVPAGSKLNAVQYKAYQAGELYVNVHSAAHTNGEIRAQLPQPMSTARSTKAY